MRRLIAFMAAVAFAVPVSAQTFVERQAWAALERAVSGARNIRNAQDAANTLTDIGGTLSDAYSTYLENERERGSNYRRRAEDGETIISCSDMGRNATGSLAALVIRFAEACRRWDAAVTGHSSSCSMETNTCTDGPNCSGVMAACTAYQAAFRNLQREHIQLSQAALRAAVSAVDTIVAVSADWTAMIDDPAFFRGVQNVQRLLSEGRGYTSGEWVGDGVFDPALRRLVQRGSALADTGFDAIWRSVRAQAAEQERTAQQRTGTGPGTGPGAPLPNRPAEPAETDGSIADQWQSAVAAAVQEVDRETAAFLGRTCGGMLAHVDALNAVARARNLIGGRFQAPNGQTYNIPVNTNETRAVSDHVDAQARRVLDHYREFEPCQR